MIQHFDEIPGRKIEGVFEFVCKLFRAAEKFDSLEARQKEYKRILDLLHDIKTFDWTIFCEMFVDNRAEKDTILMTEFPLVFVREALMKDATLRSTLLIAFFETKTHAFFSVAVKTMLPSLIQEERDVLLRFFKSRAPHVHESVHAHNIKSLEEASPFKGKPAQPSKQEGGKPDKKEENASPKPLEIKKEEPPKEVFSPDRFCKEGAYRLEQLRKNSWFSANHESNRNLISHIDLKEYGDILVDELPTHVFAEFFRFMKDNPMQAAIYYKSHLSMSIVDSLEWEEIARYYGEEVCSQYPNGRFAKLDNFSQDKVIKALISNFGVIPNQGVDADVKFILNILEEARKLNVSEARQKEQQRIFHLLCETKLDWSNFWKRVNYRDPDFILVYVREALKSNDFKKLLIAFFEAKMDSHGSQALIVNAMILKTIMPLLTEIEKDNLEAFFISRNGTAQEYFFCLNLLKPEKYPGKKENNAAPKGSEDKKTEGNSADKKENKEEVTHRDYTLIPSSEKLSADKFCKDCTYRQNELRHNSWFSTDSASNCKLILAIDPQEYGCIAVNQLPQQILKDFYTALKDKPMQMKAFCKEHFSLKILEILEEKEIALYCGEEVCQGYLGTRNFDEGALPIKDKAFKAVIKYFDSIPNHKPDLDLVGFVCEVIAKQSKSHKELIQLLCESQFNWTNFWQKLPQFVKGDDTIFTTTFPSAYVREAILRGDDSRGLLISYFEISGFALEKLSKILHSLTRVEKIELKSFFELRSGIHPLMYLPHLQLIKLSI